MDATFKEILEELQVQAPDLVVANAVVHRDEASPHMHVVAVPVGRGFENGMEAQVSKRKVCTKEFLEDILQGSMRKFVSANLFTWISELNLKGKELEVVGDVANLGKNIKKLETMVRKGPDVPKGMMTAKGYREKVVIPFVDKLYGVFRNVVDFAKGCFAQLKEVIEKYYEVSEINESLRRQNSNLREQIED